MTQLNEVQRKLAEQLLLSVKNKEMNVEYNELAQRISPPIHWRQVGKNILQPTRSCKWCLLCHVLPMDREAR